MTEAQYEAYKESCNKQDQDWLIELEGYYDSIPAMLDGVTSDHYRDHGYDHEMADGGVNPYFHNQLEWYKDHVGEFDDEAKDLSSNEGSVMGWIAGCWYVGNTQEINEAIEGLKTAIEEAEDEE